jgi:hypothetical protein
MKRAMAAYRTRLCHRIGRPVGPGTGPYNEPAPEWLRRDRALALWRDKTGHATLPTACTIEEIVDALVARTYPGGP